MLRDLIKESLKNKVAIGHFNACTIDGIWAIADAALELKLPVIAGFSEGERDYFGIKEAVAVIDSIRKERHQQIFINADHTYSFEKVRQTIDAGFDAVIFDGAKLSMADNISQTKKCVEYAGSCGRDVLVEGELGFIGSGSEVFNNVPAGAAAELGQMTTAEQAREFVKATGVDLLAPAVGNIHGVIRAGNPPLNPSRVKEISDAVKIPLVLHGASGNVAKEIKQCVRSGVAIVHVNTELRMAYRTGLIKSLSQDPEEVAPYKYMKEAKLAMQKIVKEKLIMISST